MPADRAPASVAAVFCAHFLPRDQNHVYRQVDGLPGWSTRILTWKRDEVARFPFPPERIETLPRPWTRQLRRWWYGQCRGQSWRIGPGEARAIAARIRDLDAAVLHIYFGHVAVHLLPVLEMLDRPVLVSFHGVDAAVAADSPQGQLLREVFRRACLLPARSQELLDQLGRLGAPPQRLRLWRAGIPLEQWPAVGRTAPPDGAWRLVQACRFQDKKGLDTTLRAFARLLPQWPLARLQLAGDGPQRDGLQGLARELGVADAIDWLGFLDAAGLRRLYAAAHVLLHPSRVTTAGDREGVPNAMLEAMATGLPVAATRHGGIPEALAGTSCLLVAEDDDAALAEGVARWLANPCEWAEAGASARRAVERGFDLDGQRARIAALYAEAAGAECEAPADH